MKTFITPIYLCLGLSLALMPTIASAQFPSNESNDPFKRAAAGDTSGLFSLINQVQINGKNNPNYEIQQQEQLKSATDDFRARQLQVLREQSKKNNPAQK
jgi:hypothetical protein